MAITLYTYGATDSTGWTQFGRLTAGASSICLSSSVGSDTTGTGTPGNPYKTLQKGIDTLRGLTNGVGHRLLLKEGDTWTDELFVGTGNNWLQMKGASASDPLIIGTYDPGQLDVDGNPIPFPAVAARPIVQYDSGTAAFGSANGCIFPSDAGTIDNIAVVGIDFYAYKRDPGNVSFNVSNKTQAKTIFWNSGNPALFLTFVLIEGCRFRFCETGLSFQQGSTTAINSGIYVHRNVFVDTYQAQFNANGNGRHGVFMSGSSGYIDENIFDNIGQNSTLNQPVSCTITNVGGNALVTGTWPKGAPPNGMSVSFATTGGGLTAGNGSVSLGQTYIVCNQSGSTFNVAQTGTPTTPIAYNASMVSPQNVTWCDPNGSSYNHNLYLETQGPVGPVYVRGNTMARCASGNKQDAGGQNIDNLWIQNGWTTFVWPVGGVSNPFTQNVVLEGMDHSSYGGGNGRCFDTLGSFSTPSPGSTMDLSYNIFAHGAANTTVFQVTAGYTVSSSHDVIFDYPNYNEFVNGTINFINLNLDLAGSNVNAGGTAPAEPFPAPTRTIGGYYDTVAGGSGHTTLDFITAARGQSKQSWNNSLTANSANNYIRAGFGLSAYPAVTTAHGSKSLRYRF